MTPEELKAIRERADNATPGPWNIPLYGYTISDDSGTPLFHAFGMGEQVFADMRFIGASRTDIPRLLDEIERLTRLFQSEHAVASELQEKADMLEAENERLQKQYDDLYKSYYDKCMETAWIPVEERLPESGVHVLLTCEIRPHKERYVCDGYYTAPKTVSVSCYDECALEYDEEKDEYFLLEGFYEIVKNWDDFSSVVIEDFVTHWRSLPTPPDSVDANKAEV